MYSEQAILWVMAFAFINTYGWILFAQDKKKARQHAAFRIPETTFFLVAACGGGLGACLAMFILRHKTKHVQFIVGLPVLLLTSISIFGYGLWQIFL